MRNAVNVQAALLLAIVALTSSLVTTEKLGSEQEDAASRVGLDDEAYVEAEVLEEENFDVASMEAEEHPPAQRQEIAPAAVHRGVAVAALLQSGQSALHEQQRQKEARMAEVDAAFQVALKQALAQEEASLTEEVSGSKVAASQPAFATVSQTITKHSFRSPHSTQGTAVASGKVTPASGEKRESLWLTDIFGRIDFSHLLGKKMQAVGAQSQHASEPSLPQGPNAIGIRGKFEAWRSNLIVRNHEALRIVMKGFISVLLWAALIMLLGIFYHHEKQHPPQLDPEGVNVSLHDRERMDRHRWRFGLFECMEVPSMCFMSIFCAPMRWADTMRMAGFMNYFGALAMFVGLTVLGFTTLGLGFFILLAVVVHYRQRMRKKYEINSHVCGAGSYMTDLLAYVFCPSCSIVQEARQMEEAYLARHASVHGVYFKPK